MFTTTQLIGHRGACAFAPENTFAAFEKAYEMNCRMIEFDVMLSQDNEAFVFHDDILPRTSNGSGALNEHPAAYLKTLDAGAWFSKQYAGERIPLFKDVLTWLIEKNMQANIEIKPLKKNLYQTTAIVLEHIDKLWPAGTSYPLMSSFEWDSLRICQEKAPHLPRGFLMHRWHKDWLSLAREIDCYSIHLNRHIVSERRVRDIKENGYRVLVYTVNNKNLAKSLFDVGVDAIFSDNLLIK